MYRAALCFRNNFHWNPLSTLDLFRCGERSGCAINIDGHPVKTIRCANELFHEYHRQYTKSRPSHHTVGVQRRYRSLNDALHKQSILIEKMSCVLTSLMICVYSKRIVCSKAWKFIKRLASKHSALTNASLKFLHSCIPKQLARYWTEVVTDCREESQLEDTS